jgi:hypothetical protein
MPPLYQAVAIRSQELSLLKARKPSSWGYEFPELQKRAKPIPTAHPGGALSENVPNPAKFPFSGKGGIHLRGLGGGAVDAIQFFGYDFLNF